MPGERTTITGGGLIPGGAYTPDDLMRILGVGRHTLAEMRQSKIVRPITVGNRYLYLADDVLAYLRKLQSEQYPETEAVKAAG